MALIMKTKDEEVAVKIKEDQRVFYATNKAGCAFAALAAKDPARYGWEQNVLPVEATAIQAVTDRAILNPKVSQISLIFPEVVCVSGLAQLIQTLTTLKTFQVGKEEKYEGFRCVGLRAQVGVNQSWISGFGPFAFFPITRQAPHTEIAFRVKDRPHYDRSMKESPPGVIHLADLNVGVTWAVFQTMWKATMKQTKRLLGHEPDLRSAAKTTFVLPA